jgi:hypothetical protein
MEASGHFRWFQRLTSFCARTGAKDSSLREDTVVIRQALYRLSVCAGGQEYAQYRNPCLARLDRAIEGFIFKLLLQPPMEPKFFGFHPFVRLAKNRSTSLSVGARKQFVLVLHRSLIKVAGQFASGHRCDCLGDVFIHCVSRHKKRRLRPQNVQSSRPFVCVSRCLIEPC